MEKLKCNICGHLDGEIMKTKTGSGPVRVDPEDYIESKLTKIMRKEKCCFTCAFWEDKSLVKDENTFIVNGEHYHSDKPYVDKSIIKGFLGFGGRDFYLKKEDGTILHANNLWFQGEIPDAFKDKLKDNAVFTTEEEYLDGL